MRRRCAMLWEVEIRPKGADAERERVCQEFQLLTHTAEGPNLITGSAHGYLLQGDLSAEQAERLMHELLVDSLVERGRLRGIHEGTNGQPQVTVLLKPGVMDPVALSIIDAARDLGLAVQSVRSFRRYFRGQAWSQEARDVLTRKVLANDAIEQVIEGPVTIEHLMLGQPYEFRLVTPPIRDL